MTDTINVTHCGCVHIRTEAFNAQSGQYTYSRRTITPADDYSSESAEVQAICAATFTQPVIDAFNQLNSKFR